MQINCPNRSPPNYEVCKDCRDRKVPFFWLECKKTQFQADKKKPPKMEGFVTASMFAASNSRFYHGVKQ